MTRAMRVWERTLLGIAVAWGLALPVLAVVAPAYSSESVEMSSDGTAVSGESSATLAQVDGAQSVLVAAIPLLIAVLVALLLHWRRPNHGPGVVATVLIALLAVGTFLAMLSIGIVVLPITVCLAFAWAIRLAAATPSAAPSATAPVHPVR